MPFSCYFDNSLISFMHGHNSEYYGLGHWPLCQNCVKNSNLILKLMYQVHSIFELDIFDSFGALFFLFHTPMTAFTYESKTCQNFWHLSINQLFVLFHLVGVPCWPIVDLFNFFDGLWRKVEKKPKKLMIMSIYMISLSSDLISDSRFEFFGKFWYREHSL